MNRFVRQILFAATVVTTGVAGSQGCADSESMIFIRQVNLLQPGGTGGICTVEPSPSALFESLGVLDVAFRTEYRAFLLVGNQMVGRANGRQLKTETSRVQLEGAEVRIVDDFRGVTLANYTVPGSGFVDPASSDTPNFGLMETTLIDSATGQGLAAQLSATPRTVVQRLTTHTKVFGKTLGGLDVESGEWTYPINVCYGCLVSFPSDADTPGDNTPDCNNTAASSTTTTPCTLGQDGPVDCRLCKLSTNNAAICNP